MSALTWLMLANMALWIGLGVFVAFLALSQKKLNQRLADLERPELKDER